MLMYRARTLSLCLIAIVAAMCADESRSDQPVKKSFFVIGNSLTWDTVPGLLSGDVQWHVDCGKSLPFLRANPDKPCVKSSTLWPAAFKQKQYDVVSVQPHYGSTLIQDVETISAWMKTQPKAVFVIHSGWAHHAAREEEFANPDPTEKMQHSPAYYRALVAELRRLHPGRTLRQTRAINLLAQIAEDIAAKKAPFDDITDLHRDVIHMKHESGKYLMHNAMRHALGQPMSAVGFKEMDANVRRYLNGVLALLTIEQSDEKLLNQILSLADNLDRQSLVAEISDDDLRTRTSDLLPRIERAASLRRRTLALQAEIEDIGGKIHFASSAPQWLYLAASDAATDLFETPITIDLYNGNNPLKGRGGKNERVTDAWLERLSGLTSLQKLDISNCQIQGDGLRHVGTLTGLQALNLTLTPVSDDGLAHLGTLTELRNLGLASTQCTGTGFSHLTALKKLENVNFHYTPLNDAGLRAISKVGVSGRFWFAHTHFTDKGAESLSAMTGLRRCGIGSKEAASSGDAVASLIKLPLEELYLLDEQASPEGLAHASKIKTLRRLDASYAPNVGDAAMKLIAQMPRLEEFKIGSAQVTDEGIGALAESKSLKKLTLERLKNVSEGAIEQLRKSRPEMTIEVR
jgi:hypothetical protein